jgi:hypothetical protein
MAGLIDRVGPVKLRPRRLPPFQSLTHAVIHQQLSGQAAGTILGRFRALFGDDGFPTPEAVLKASPERLRSAGLSRPKASYVLGIAQKAVDGHIPTLDECERMTDAELIERLTSIKGVGRWTAEMLLIFNLGQARCSAGRRLGCQEGLPVRLRQAEAAGAGATRPLRPPVVTAPHYGGVVFVEGRRFLGRGRLVSRLPFGFRQAESSPRIPVFSPIAGKVSYFADRTANSKPLSQQPAKVAQQTAMRFAQGMLHQVRSMPLEILTVRDCRELCPDLHDLQAEVGRVATAAPVGHFSAQNPLDSAGPNLAEQRLDECGLRAQLVGIIRFLAGHAPLRERRVCPDSRETSGRGQYQVGQDHGRLHSTRRFMG